MLPRTFMRRKQLPIFVIDEPNRLKNLLRDANGQAALECIFEWFVLYTKEKCHFHIVLLSSDSFFNLWVEQFVGPTRYSVYVLGHLERKEAESYWEEVVLMQNAHQLKINAPQFEDIFKVCGGVCF